MDQPTVAQLIKEWYIDAKHDEEFIELQFLPRFKHNLPVWGWIGLMNSDGIAEFGSDRSRYLAFALCQDLQLSKKYITAETFDDAVDKLTALLDAWWLEWTEAKESEEVED